MSASERAGLTSEWPELPLEAWEDTKNTLHLYLQIVGKVRLGLHPKVNHWWHVPFYVSPRGLTTAAIPYDNRAFEMEFDFLDHRLHFRTSDGERRELALAPRPVADFYSDVFSTLDSLGVRVNILAKPFGVSMTEPFATDREHASYDPEYVTRFWRILVRIDPIFKEFRGRFIGKCSPVHLFWHSFDLAVTRFSGRRAPASDGADPVTKEAYSHEVVSCGFWAGDENTPAPAFYAYAFPEPPGLQDQPLRPDAAYWTTLRGASMALLMYDEVRKAEDPKAMILDFLQSSYEAGANLASWDRQVLEG